MSERATIGCTNSTIQAKSKSRLGDEYRFEEEPMGYAGVKASSNPLLSDSKSLKTKGNDVTESGEATWKNLASGILSMKNLTTLNLQWKNIGDEGATGLSKNSSWKNLTTFNLERNEISAKGATELSKNPSWTNLTILNLGGNSIGAKGASELSKNNSWTNLAELYLQGNDIGAEGAVELSKNTS